MADQMLDDKMRESTKLINRVVQDGLSAECVLDEIAFDHSQSVMIALELPESTQLALQSIGYDQNDETAPDDPPHVTLVYLGEKQRHKLNDIVKAIRPIVSNQEMLQAAITGLAFLKEGPDGTPLVALVTCKGLEHLKVRLETALLNAGIDTPSEYGFVPHTTIKYLPTRTYTGGPNVIPQNLPLITQDQNIVWNVDKICVYADNNTTKIDLPFPAHD